MNDIDRSWSDFYKFSGISQILAAIFFVIGIVLLIYIEKILGTSTDRLEMLAKHKFLFQLGNGSCILADIFGILGILGVYLSLYKLKKSLVLAMASLQILGAVLAIGLRFGVHAEIELAINYVKAASESVQINYVAAANVIQGVSDIGLSLANLLLCVGGLIGGVAMLAGVFSKKIAYLYIISGFLGIVGFIGVVFTQAFVPIILLSCIVTIISMILVGFRLYAIGKNINLQQEAI